MRASTSRCRVQVTEARAKQVDQASAVTVNPLTGAGAGRHRRWQLGSACTGPIEQCTPHSHHTEHMGRHSARLEVHHPVARTTAVERIDYRHHTAAGHCVVGGRHLHCSFLSVYMLARINKRLDGQLTTCSTFW